LTQSSFLGRSRISTSWLFQFPFHGSAAVSITIAAVVIPTVISFSLPTDIMAQACTLLCPFVLLTAILCGWRYALAAALSNALVCNVALMGQPYGLHLDVNAIAIVSTFLAYSAFIIIIVRLFRRTAARSLRQAGAKERSGGIIFSLDGGQAWASWYGIDAPVRLGPPEEVVPMMEDFLAQMKAGERLQASTRPKPLTR
jgi:hypothetical protein